MLTKSLHTVTAVTNVAQYILLRAPADHYTSGPHPAVDLMSDALGVLGYGDLVGHGLRAEDPTIAKIVKACAKLLAVRS